MVRLFNGYSTVPRFLKDRYVFEGVPFSWFVRREEPAFPLVALVVNAGDLSRRQKEYTSRFLCGCFSQEEAEAFHAWASKHLRMDLRWEEIALPLRVPPTGFSISPSDLPLGGLKGILELHEQSNYDVPFRVAGYYNAEGCAKALALTEELESKGAIYIQMALKFMGLHKGVTTEQVAHAVQALYEGLGLIVIDKHEDK